MAYAGMKPIPEIESLDLSDLYGMEAFIYEPGDPGKRDKPVELRGYVESGMVCVERSRFDTVRHDDFSKTGTAYRLCFVSRNDIEESMKAVQPFVKNEQKVWVRIVTEHTHPVCTDPR